MRHNLIPKCMSFHCHTAVFYSVFHVVVQELLHSYKFDTYAPLFDVPSMLSCRTPLPASTTYWKFRPLASDIFTRHHLRLRSSSFVEIAGPCVPYVTFSNSITFYPFSCRVPCCALLVVFRPPCKSFRAPSLTTMKDNKFEELQ